MNWQGTYIAVDKAMEIFVYLFEQILFAIYC